MKLVIRTQDVDRYIHVIRRQKVMLDSDLAVIYGVTTSALIQAVNRNKERFPIDFMFNLTEDEFKILRSQFVISKDPRGGRRYLPYAFTENGVAMLSSVLRSPRAIKANIEIMRAFTRLRRAMTSNEWLREKLFAMEQRYDKQFAVVFRAIQQLLDGPMKPVKVKGFER